MIKLCTCHDSPMQWVPDTRYRDGGYWLCAIKNRDSSRTSRARKREGLPTPLRAPISAETRAALSGENAPNWMGGEVGYDGLHVRVRKVKGPLIGTCSVCGDAPPTTIRSNGRPKPGTCWANVSGQYLDPVDHPEDWAEKCASCNAKDGVPIHPRFTTGGHLRGRHRLVVETPRS